jgi:hypothetical protein
LAAGLIEALAGIGSFPCWINEALRMTEGGSVVPAPVGVTTAPCPGAPFTAGTTGGAAPPWALGGTLAAPGATGAGGWLMTVLMTVVL